MSKKIKSKLIPQLTFNSNSIWQLKPKPKLVPSTRFKQHWTPGMELEEKLLDRSLHTKVRRETRKERSKACDQHLLSQETQW